MIIQLKDDIIHTRIFCVNTTAKWLTHYDELNSNFFWSKSINSFTCENSCIIFSYMLYFQGFSSFLVAIPHKIYNFSILTPFYHGLRKAWHWTYQSYCITNSTDFLKFFLFCMRWTYSNRKNYELYLVRVLQLSLYNKIISNDLMTIHTSDTNLRVDRWRQRHKH